MSKYSENMPPSLRGAIEWMYDYIKPNTVVLDFGCSTGYFGEYLKKNKNCTVYGVEISDDILQAKKVLDGVYSFDLDGDWPEEVFERKYDSLFYGDVLEHLKDPAAALRKSASLLKSGGKIFVSVPNIAHISTRLELLSGNFEYEPMGILDTTHLKYFTLHSFSDMAKSAGYEVLATDYTLNEYPTDTINKMLNDLGLTASNKFWEIIDSVEARAFQYKFVLAPKTSTATVKPSRSNIKKPEQQRDAQIDELKAQVVDLRKHAEEQAKVIQHHLNEVNRLNEANKVLTQQLENRFTRKLKNRAQHAANRLRKK